MGKGCRVNVSSCGAILRAPRVLQPYSPQPETPKWMSQRDFGVNCTAPSAGGCSLAALVSGWLLLLKIRHPWNSSALAFGCLVAEKSQAFYLVPVNCTVWNFLGSHQSPHTDLFAIPMSPEVFAAAELALSKVHEVPSLKVFGEALSWQKMKDKTHFFNIVTMWN